MARWPAGRIIVIAEALLATWPELQVVPAFLRGRLIAGWVLWAATTGWRDFRDCMDRRGGPRISPPPAPMSAMTTSLPIQPLCHGAGRAAGTGGRVRGD